MKPTPGRRPSTPMIRRKREQLLFEHGPFCAICGRLIIKGRVTLDHRKPIRRGGSNCLDNLDLAHAHCNEAKGSALWPAPEPPPECWCHTAVGALRRRPPETISSVRQAVAVR